MSQLQRRSENQIFISNFVFQLGTTVKFCISLLKNQRPLGYNCKISHFAVKANAHLGKTVKFRIFL